MWNNIVYIADKANTGAVIIVGLAALTSITLGLLSANRPNCKKWQEKLDRQSKYMYAALWITFFIKIVNTEYKNVFMWAFIVCMIFWMLSDKAKNDYKKYLEESRERHRKDSNDLQHQLWRLKIYIQNNPEIPMTVVDELHEKNWLKEKESL